MPGYNRQERCFFMGYLPSMTGKTIINEGFDGTLVGISWDI